MEDHADALALEPSWYDEATAVFDEHEVREEMEARVTPVLWSRYTSDHEKRKHFYTTRVHPSYQPVPSHWAACAPPAYAAFQFRWLDGAQDAALVFVPTRTGMPLLAVVAALLRATPPDPRAAVVLHYLHALRAWQDELVPIPRLLHDAVAALPSDTAVPTALGDIVGRVEHYDASRHRRHITHYLRIVHQPWPGNGWSVE